MEYKEIQDLTVEELRKRRQAMSEELFQSKMKLTLGQLGNPLSVRTLRRDLARINTLLSAKLSR